MVCEGKNCIYSFYLLEVLLWGMGKEYELCISYRKLRWIHYYTSNYAGRLVLFIILVVTVQDL